jgi:hypothetical protein
MNGAPLLSPHELRMTQSRGTNQRMPGGSRLPSNPPLRRG